jgi:nucleoside-diphosphate-sugar epimerase
MRLVVTGASGFVGRALVVAAARAGHTGIATGRRPPEALPAGWEGWCRDEVLASAPSPPPPDALVHLEVRQAQGGPAAVELAELHRVNVEGTAAWLQWAARHGIGRVVLASSVLAVARSPGPITEEAPPETSAPYGASKARAEAAVREWAGAAPGRGAVILRPAPVYGPDRRSNLVNFVSRVAHGRTSLIGSGAARKSIVSRDNLVAALLHCAAHAEPGCTVYNVADREGHSIAELASIVAALTGAPRPRSAPLWLARLAAPVADALGMLSGRDLPLSSARLHAATAPGYFPCQRLIAAGFVHPQSTREGLAAMIAGLGITAPPPAHPPPPDNLAAHPE